VTLRREKTEEELQPTNMKAYELSKNDSSSEENYGEAAVCGDLTAHIKACVSGNEVKVRR
jgi:hypothetical protein